MCNERNNEDENVEEPVYHETGYERVQPEKKKEKKPWE